jgi:oligopeptide/dipeptide ABC transporter ATP-binding protein
MEPDAGRVAFQGRDLLALSPAELRALRRDMQLIFQDPYASLNPRLTIGQIIEESLVVHGLGEPAERRDRVAGVLRRVGLRPELMDRHPHEFSGGQRQRVGIARALVLNPRLIVADEPVSALDVSIQAQVMNLLLELQEELGLTYLIIAHDLSVVEHLSDRVAVMYLGRVVELASDRQLYVEPLHPYSRGLLAAIPSLTPGAARPARRLRGETPSPLDPPPGCHFHPRCPERLSLCDKYRPRLLEKTAGHLVACHLYHPPREEDRVPTAPAAG